MRYGDHNIVKQPERNEALFRVGLTGILRRDGIPREDRFGVGEVNPVFPEVRATLVLVPGEHPAM